MKNLQNTYDWLTIADPTKVHFPGFESIKKFLIEEIDEFMEAVKTGDVDEMKNAIVDIEWVNANLAYYADLTVQQLSEESDYVYLSNMTKFDEHQEDAEKTVELYKLGLHPNKLGKAIDTYWIKVGNYYVIRRVEDNKILKSHKFKDSLEI